MSVPMKQRYASSGVQTIGSPRILKLVFTITGQPVHLQSPLVPAILLLVSLAGVNLGDHHRKVLWRAVIVSLVMLGIGILVGAVPFFVAQ